MRIGRIRSKFHVMFCQCSCLGTALTSLVGFAGIGDEELNELIREAINEIRFFRIMYAAIWIPLFTMLIILSYVNYRLYKRQISENNMEPRDNTPTVHLRKDLYDSIVKKGEEVSSFVNRVVEESLKSS